MASVGHLLPPPKSTSSSFYDLARQPWFKERFSSCGSESIALKPDPIPPYGSRSGFVPRKLGDFGDGGAFPEIRVAQYPLGMEPAVDAVVYFERLESTRRTKEAFEKILNAVPTPSLSSSESKFIKYSSSEQERMVRMVEMPRDPLEPPKFRHKRIPRAPGSPPMPVMRSPLRPVTLEDQRDWKIPPCISNWKNPKGYVIPLDKRLAADGRGLREVAIGDKFANLAEALYVSENRAREEVAMRSRVRRELMMREEERKEQELRALARKARSRELPEETREDREGRMGRDELREERRLERKKSKITRDGDRDVSEKIALGVANTGARRTGELMCDQRLFNQDRGMQAGFAVDDQYNLYDKGLFTAQSTLSTLFRPKKGADSDMYVGADEQQEKNSETDRFKPDRAFMGVSGRPSCTKRERPVEFDMFDKQEELDDLFNFDAFFTATMRKGKQGYA